MRISCRRDVGGGNVGGGNVGGGNVDVEVIRLRSLSAERREELRTAIRAARDGTGAGELFVCERGYSPRGRALARLVVGLTVVVALATAMAAFVAPDAASLIVGVGLVPAVLIGGFTAWFSSTHDTGVRIDSGGTLRTEGWAGIREVDLRSFAQVVVSGDARSDGDGSASKA